ncbi:MAG TPA: hypothetical protein VMN60_06255 [Longimicrobiales bacterium]|nr:hypothetical protein [Longimicrobiales bacterium]
MLNEDYRDILTALVRNRARFLVVGAHALAAHGYPRATVALDVWIESTARNAARVWRALVEFGAPLEDLGIRESDFTRPDIVAQFGLPPTRIDLLTSLTGLTFEHAWGNRIEHVVEDVPVPILGREELIVNKLATGRDKDRVDVNGLRGET